MKLQTKIFNPVYMYIVIVIISDIDVRYASGKFSLSVM